MSIALISSKSTKFLQLLKPYVKPHSSFLHLATEKPNNNLPSSSSSITQIIDFLKSNDKQSWSTNDQLSQAICSLSSDNFLEIVRGLKSYSIGFDFIEHLQSMPKSPDEKSLTFAFQAVFKLASREPDGENKVLQVYEKAKEWGVGLSVNSVTRLMICLSRGGMVDKMIMIYADLEPQLRNVRVCNVVIYGLVRNCRLDYALKVLDEMLEPNSEILPDENTMKIVFPALFRGKEFGRWVSDEEILEMVVRFGKRGLLFDSVRFNHLCNSMRVDEAMDLFEKIRRGEIISDVKPDVVIYNNLIKRLCKTGRIEEGLAMMRRMRSESECSPGTITFNCLIYWFCKNEEIDRAFALFKEMNKEEVEPSIATVNSLVSGLCRNGRAGCALKLYRTMQEKGLDGNVKTYTTLIGAFCSAKNLSKAMELFTEVKEKCPPAAIVYYTLIFGLSHVGLMNEAETTLSEMKNGGFFPDICCYNVMINGFCQKNEIDKAFELLNDMETDGIKPDSFTYNTLILYFSTIGDLKTASTILNQMINNGIVPIVITHDTLIHSLCSRGELDEAMKIFREAECFRTTPPNTEIYNTLIDCHCQNNNVDGGLLLLDEMLGKGVKPDANTFNALFKALREENCPETALKLMDKMTEHGCSPDPVTLEVLTQWLSK